MLIHCGTKQIDSGNITLRQFRHTDGDNMLQYWVSDPKIQSMYAEPTYTTKEEVKDLLDKYIDAYTKDDYYRWAIIEKQSNICIGQIAIFLVNTKNQFCEIEYCIGSEFHRKGYASMAVHLVLDFCFNKVNFHKVQVCHREDNNASRGVIQKNNFVYEGTLRDFFYVDGVYINRLYYSILKNEYQTS